MPPKSSRAPATAESPVGSPAGSKVTMTRNLKKDDDFIDGIMFHAVSVPDAKSVRLVDGVPIIHHEDPVSLGSDIFMRMLDVAITTDDGIQVPAAYTFEVWSPSKDIAHIMRYLHELEDVYRAQKQNKFGQKLYFFNHVQKNLQKRLVMNSHGHTVGQNINYDSAERYATFTMTQFQTARSLSNVYGETIRKIRKHVEFFMDNRDWYDKKGIPYTLGILLHGPTGSGKTSLVKALAHDFKRHVLNVKMSEHVTNTQLTQLFLSDTLHIDDEGRHETFQVPVSKRIMVLEDIDCMGSAVVKRKSPPKLHDPNINFVEEVENDHPEKPNMSTILNLLDGILETPGRILIMTTNRPEVLDPALIRPGRVDILARLGECTTSDVVEIVNGITDSDLGAALAGVPDKVLTPAEVSQISIRNIDDHERIVAELLEKAGAVTTDRRPTST